MFGKKKNEEGGIAAVDQQIAQTNGKRDGHFLELGRLYYADNAKEELDGEYKTIFDSIKECDSRLEELGDERLRLQGLVRCKSCNASVVIGSAFCNHCGAKIEESEIDGLGLCHKCGKQFDSSADFCPYCGTRRG